MPCKWMDPLSLPRLEPGNRIVLFGAGQGSVELIQWFGEQGWTPIILAVADNNSSLWGKRLESIPIIAPAAIPEMQPEHVIVTTVSGRDSVTCQLLDMGLSPDRDFTCIGIYPSACMNTLRLFRDLAPMARPPARVLHVGPGGFLGLECCLYALGFDVLSMDANTFAMDYPDVTTRMIDYERALMSMLGSSLWQDMDLPPDRIKARFRSLFVSRRERTCLAADALPFIHPARFSAIPLKDGSVNMVLSNAVLEHARNPEQAVREIHRVLAPGGLAIQRIITRDHRSFGRVPGFTPFSYLRHSEEDWERIASATFYQNRVLPHAWQELFRAAGFHIETYATLQHHHLDPDERAMLHPDFRNLPEEALSEINCDILARKPM